MVAAVEHRFGTVNRLPVTIEWLSDNSSCYIADIGLEPITTPIESPQSNGMAEDLRPHDQTRLRSRQPAAHAKSVMRQLPSWITHYNEVPPQGARLSFTP